MIKHLGRFCGDKGYASQKNCDLLALRNYMEFLLDAMVFNIKKTVMMAELITGVFRKGKNYPNRAGDTTYRV